MTPAELDWWSDHWAKFPIYDDSLMVRPQEPEDMNNQIKSFFAKLGAHNGKQ